MKHEKFINFLTEISIDKNEILCESIMEAYGLCFFGVSLRKEADKILESVSGNKALYESGVLDTMRKWPRKKIMGLVLGALITMTATKGMAANSPEVITGATQNVIQQITDNHASDIPTPEENAVKNVVKKIADKNADKIDDKAKDTPTTHSDATGVDQIHEKANGYIDYRLNRGDSLEKITETALTFFHSDNPDMKKLAVAMHDVLKERFIDNESSHDRGPDNAYAELDENEKLGNSGMTDKDIAIFRLSEHKNGKGSYNYNAGHATQEDLSDKENVEKLQQQAHKILSKG